MKPTNTRMIFLGNSMKPSVPQQLLTFLETNTGTFASGELQRMTWLNKDRTNATPRSIVRRLQELAEDGKIHVQEINGHAHYSGKPIIKPPKPVKGFVMIDGVKTLV